MAHLAPTAVICNYYREVSLLSRIECRGIMYPSLQCNTQPGSYLYFNAKYTSRNEKGAVKHLTNRLLKEHILKP